MNQVEMYDGVTHGHTGTPLPLDGKQQNLAD